MERTERIYRLILKLAQRPDGFYTLDQYETRMGRLANIARKEA